MNKRNQNTFEYNGFGFPIILINFPLIEVRGNIVPNIDYNKLQHVVLLNLARNPFPLSGNEVRFIRQFLEMTYSQLAKELGVTHAAVLHWEKAKDDSAKITSSTEMFIKLKVLDALAVKNKIFRESFRNFNLISKNKSNKRHILNIDSASLKSYEAHISK